MNILILKPGVRSIECSCRESKTGNSRVFALDTLNLLENLANLKINILKNKLFAQPDAIAVRINYGGMEFKNATIDFAQPGTVEKLEKIVLQAPLHTPVVLELLETIRQLFLGTPIILFFETAFFTRLPQRESAYAINRELSKTLNLRRYGYCGLYHEAATEFTASTRRSQGTTTATRILSICLEPHPEIAAITGRNPIMCTSGATPLEGIPGQTSCGELDPGIVIMLAKKLKCGPEQINTLLTQKSGLLGLTGGDVTLEMVLEGGEDFEAARALLLNRILLACGAAMAAMGGVDDIVFSGRYIAAGQKLGQWLKERLQFKPLSPNKIAIHSFNKSIDRIIADKATVFMLESKMPVKSAVSSGMHRKKLVVA